MKKENIASIAIYLLLITAAIITGSTVVEKAFGSYDLSMSSYLFAILVIVFGLIFNVICLELLHVLGAKVGGYKVVSVNVLGFNFEKRENKWKFSFKDFDGLTGETRVVKEKEKSNIKPYIWFPLLGYILEFALMMVLYTLSQNHTASSKIPGWLAAFSILLIIISSMITLYNIVPLKLDTMTDGYRLMLISKKENVEAFNEWMRIENLARNGEEIESVQTFDSINDFTAEVNLFAVYTLIGKGKLNEADELIDKMLAMREQLDETIMYRLICQKTFILLKQDKFEEAKECYTKEKGDKIRKFACSDKAIETLRAYVLIAGFIEDSQSEVEFVISKKKKTLETTLKTRAETESKLFDECAKEVYEKHSDWQKQQ